MKHFHSVERGYRSQPEKRAKLERKVTAETLAYTGRKATEHAVFAALRTIEERYNGRGVLTKEEIAKLKIDLDSAAVSAMEAVFWEQNLGCIVSVGSEGAKEVLHAGSAAPSVQGYFGENKQAYIDCVSDPVEGTSAASQRQPGAVSVIAFGEKGGLLASREQVYYMEKLFASEQLRGVLSLHNSPLENIQAALAHLGIPPQELHVVMLDRPRNNEHKWAAQKMGVSLHLLEGGDLMPGLLAVSNLSEKPVILMGSGGYEEGVIVAAAAKALGGFAQGRVLNQDPNLPQNGVLELQDLVPGKKEHCVVTATAITQDPWFGLQAATRKVRGDMERFAVESITFTHHGVQVYHPEKTR